MYCEQTIIQIFLFKKKYENIEIKKNNILLENIWVIMRPYCKVLPEKEKKNRRKEVKG